MGIEDDSSASYKLLASSFKKMGYTVNTKKNNKDQMVVTFVSPQGATWRTLGANIGYPFNSAKAKNFSKNKNLAYSLAKEEGVSIPPTHIVNSSTSDQKLKKILKEHCLLVVKPTNSTLSRGVTLNIKNLAQLKKAVFDASKISDPVLVQEQVEGQEVRFAVLNGKVKGALLRQTPRVVGDGISSVANLIKEENKQRSDLKLEHINYPLLNEGIIDKSLIESDQILAKGEAKELSLSTMIKNGCSVYNVIKQVDKGYIEVAEKLFNKLETGFLVVDIFCKDFTKPPSQDNYYFIEFNTAPVLKLFYGCRDGKMVDIIPELVQSIHERISRNN